MKIHIIGGSGTGKSFISKKIEKQYNITHYDLDDIFGDNTALSYDTKMPIEIRTEKLSEILQKDNWVIEGVYYDWLNESFCSADRIFILQTLPIIFNFRIIRRFIKRKLGLEKGKRETIESLQDLLVWTNNYQKHKIPKIIKFLTPYKDKVFVIKNANEIFECINLYFANNKFIEHQEL